MLAKAMIPKLRNSGRSVIGEQLYSVGCEPVPGASEISLLGRQDDEARATSHPVGSPVHRVHIPALALHDVLSNDV